MDEVDSNMLSCNQKLRLQSGAEVWLSDGGGVTPEGMPSGMRRGSGLGGPDIGQSVKCKQDVIDNESSE